MNARDDGDQQRSRGGAKSRAMVETAQSLSGGRVLDAVVDVPDVRDKIFQASLAPLRGSIVPWRDGAPWWSFERVRDQGRNASCVGHALAAAIDHQRAQAIIASGPSCPLAGTLEQPWVSWRMLYHTAKFHDEWTGEAYSGSSVRGGLKGFFYNGVCAIDKEPSSDRFSRQAGNSDWTWYMTKTLVDSARTIQLGAYYRVLPRLTDMHAAINEASTVVVSAFIHAGWQRPAEGNVIAYNESLPARARKKVGLHAFAIVGYDDNGFWVQNSWGRGWGSNGLALWRYEDWADNICDAWVLRLAVLPERENRHSPGIITARSGRIEIAETHFLSQQPQDQSGPSRLDILGHLVPFRDGRLDRYGPYNVNSLTLQETFNLIQRRCSNTGENKFQSSFLPKGAKKTTAEDYHYKHVLIYFVGGWPDENLLANQLRDLIPTFTKLGIYPFFVSWDTPIFKELEGLVRRSIADVAQQTRNTPSYRRQVRDRLVEGRIALPANRILRELRASARRIFRPDQPDPDVLSDLNRTAEGTFCLRELFRELEPRYRRREISFHFAAHGFGAQALIECLANQELLLDSGEPFNLPAFSTCTLVSPLVAKDSVAGRQSRDSGNCLAGCISSRNDIIPRTAKSARLSLEKLTLIVLNKQSNNLDRFSDQYSGSWPELWSRVLGLEPGDRRVMPPEDGSMSHHRPVLPLLSDPAIALKFVEDCRRDGLNANLRYVRSQEDDADASLHHELGFHSSVLDWLVHDILGRTGDVNSLFPSQSRRITLTEPDDATAASR